MIKLDFSIGISLYLFIFVAGLLILWIISEDKVRKRKFYSEEGFIWHCSICTYTYVDSMHETLSKCPRCGSYNERPTSERSEQGGGDDY